MPAASGVAAPLWKAPTRLSTTLYHAKVAAFRLRRAAADGLHPPPRLARTGAAGWPAVIAERVTPLCSDPTPAERRHQLGKIQNLRIAARSLDGLVIPEGAVFSFWRHVGRPAARRGFVPGRMLQEGCMVSAVGGGLCQLSNALYATALQAGCRILERHAHSRVVPFSAAAAGRDATVAWNYVDLRFTPGRTLRLAVRLDRDRLVVRLLAPDGPHAPPAAPAPDDPDHLHPHPPPRTCATCDEHGCFRHERAPLARDRHVFLLDEAWPEFRAHAAAVRQPGDGLGRPVSLLSRRRPTPLPGFDAVGAVPLAATARSLGLRLAGAEAASRRAAELRHAGRIARALGRRLPLDAGRVTVAQSLLPFLWRDGWLGGREVAVLMTALPLSHLHARLDEAAAHHPDQVALADFRAPPWLVEAEAEALAACATVITPHAEIAALFGRRALELPWSELPARPRAARATAANRVAFPGPTAARKGAYAVRAAARALGLEVVPLGSELEGERFWQGVRTTREPLDWDTIGAVVQPAWVEHQPRPLLAALAAGVPVLATAACGLRPRPGLTLVPPGDPAALQQALAATLNLS